MLLYLGISVSGFIIIFYDSKIPLWLIVLYMIIILPACILTTDLFSNIIHFTGDIPVKWRFKPLQQYHILSVEHHTHPEELSSVSFFELRGNNGFLYLPLILLSFLFFSQNLFPFIFIPSVFLSFFLLTAVNLHRWCHTTKVPVFILWLQNKNIFIGKNYHMFHHKPPYDSHFSGLNGWSDKLIDKFKIHERLIHLYRKFEFKN